MLVDEDPLAQKLAQLKLITTNPLFSSKNALSDYQRIVDEYIQWGMYKNDTRFVKLCIEYANMNENPKIVFEALKTKGVGQYCALFYQQHAAFLLSRGAKYEANSIIRAGLFVKAQPVQLLEMMADGEYPSLPEQPQLQMLSAKKSLNSITDDPISVLRKNKLSIPPSNTSNNPKRKFAVYSDASERNTPTRKKANTQLSPLAIDEAIRSQQNNFSEEELDLLTYNEQLLLFRRFDKPINPFGKRSLTKIQAAKTTALISHDERLYINHLGYTEVFNPSGLDSVME